MEKKLQQIKVRDSKSPNTFACDEPTDGAWIDTVPHEELYK